MGGNPAFGKDCLRGAKLVNEKDKKIVGFIGLIPLKINLKSSNEIAYAFTTWRVNEEFRKYSLDLLYFINEILDDKICFNFTANEIATFYFKIEISKIDKDKLMLISILMIHSFQGYFQRKRF